MASAVLKYFRGNAIVPLRVAYAVLFILLVAPVFFLKDLTLDSSLYELFEPDHPTLINEARIREHFPEDDIVIAMFAGAELLNDENIVRFEKLIDAISADELVERVISPFTLDHIKGTEDGFLVEKLITSENTRGMSLEQRRQKIVTDHIAPNFVASNDAGVLALIVRPWRQLDDPSSVYLYERIEELVESNGLEDYFRGQTGHIGMSTNVYYTVLKDNMTFLPLATVIGLGLLWWMYRRLLPVVLGSLIISAVVLPSVSLLPMMKQDFSMTTSMTSPLLVALAVALLIHFFNSVVRAEVCGATGAEKYLAAVREIERPARFTSMTTAIGLLSLNFSPVPPLRNFGNTSAFGVVLLYLIVILFLPALLQRFDRHNWSERISGKGGAYWIDNLIQPVARLGVRHAARVCLCILILVGLGLPQLNNIVVETDNFTMFPLTHKFRKTTSLFEDNIAGTVPLEIIFTGDGRDSLKDHEKLQFLKQFEEWCLSQEEIDHVNIMTDIIEDMHWAFHNEDPAYRTLPDNIQLITQYLFVYDGIDLYELVDREFENTRVALNLNIHGSRAIGGVIERVSGYLEENNAGMKWEVTGVGKMFADLDRELIDGQIKSGIAAIFLITLLMIVIWRSLYFGLITMIPNAAPVLIIFIGLGLLDITLNTGTAVVTSVAIGIAVDDTIHLFQRFYKSYREGNNPVIGLVRSYHSAGKAIVATTLILCSQFFIMMTSEFLPTYQFGFMTGVGLFAALVFDLLLFPALLILMTYGHWYRKYRIPATAG